MDFLQKNGILLKLKKKETRISITSLYSSLKGMCTGITAQFVGPGRAVYGSTNVHLPHPNILRSILAWKVRAWKI